MASDKTEWLSIKQNGYLNTMAINRKYWLSIEQNIISIAFICRSAGCHPVLGPIFALQRRLPTLGKVSKKTVSIWDFVPNVGPHPPTAHVWDSTK